MLSKLYDVEKVILRDLEPTEAEFILNKGEELFYAEMLGWDEQDFRLMKRMTEIISAYCTMHYDEYREKLKKDDSLLIPVASVLKTIASEIEEFVEENKKEKESEASKLAQRTADVLNSIEDKDKKWVNIYNKIDPDNFELINTIINTEEDSLQEAVEKALEVLKDTVLKHYTNKVEK